MYNLKRSGGTFKGLIGEAMFKITRENLILTRFFNKNKYLRIFGKYLSPIQKDFLFNNWYSIDALEIDYSSYPRGIILYEIKTLNNNFIPSLNGLNKIPKITLNSYNLYNYAVSLGFNVFVAYVLLNSNWDYDIKIEDFTKCKFSIDKPKNYDK